MYRYSSFCYFQDNKNVITYIQPLTCGPKHGREVGGGAIDTPLLSHDVCKVSSRLHGIAVFPSYACEEHRYWIHTRTEAVSNTSHSHLVTSTALTSNLVRRLNIYVPYGKYPGWVVECCIPDCKVPLPLPAFKHTPTLHVLQRRNKFQNLSVVNFMSRSQMQELCKLAFFLS